MGEREARSFPGTQPCRLGLRRLPGRGCRCRCRRHRPACPRPPAAAGRPLPRCPVTPAALRNCCSQRWLWLSLTSGRPIGHSTVSLGSGRRLRRMSRSRPARSRAGHGLCSAAPGGECAAPRGAWRSRCGLPACPPSAAPPGAPGGMAVGAVPGRQHRAQPCARRRAARTAIRTRSLLS